MSLLDSLLLRINRILWNGVAQPFRTALNFGAGFSVTDDPTLGTTDITVTGQNIPLTNPNVVGETTWNPSTLAPVSAASTMSAPFTAQTTPSAYSNIQVGPNIPLPGNVGAPSNGQLRVDYEMDACGFSSAVGAYWKGSWAWDVFGSTVVSHGATPLQPITSGTNGGAPPVNWLATLVDQFGEAKLTITTDTSDTYDVSAIIQWRYTQ